MNQVVYASRGGNAKKLAEAMASGAEATVKPVNSISNMKDVDVLFVGSGIYAGKIDASMRGFLQGLKSSQAKKVVVFSTAGGNKHALPEVRSILEPKGIAVSEEDYHCRGAFLLVNRGRPNDDDLKEAERFARRQSEV